MSEVAVYVILFGLGALVVLTAFVLQKLTQAVELLREITNGSQPRPRQPPTGKAMFVTLALATAGWASSPAEAVAAAHKDLGTIPPAARRYVRYLSAYNFREAKTLLELRKVSDFWVNSLSRNRLIYRLHPVADNLWRLDLRHYQMPAGVWEKLANSEVYFHRDYGVDRVPIGEEAKPVEYEWKRVEWEGGDWPNGDGTTTYYAKGAFSYQKKVPKAPPAVSPTSREVVGAPTWADAKLYGELVKATQSQVPIVRADWFIVRTSQQDETDGHGYFDFLGLKTRDDLDDLAALDRKLVERKLEEVRAVVPISSVAINGRQVARLATIQGGYWVTLDTIRQAKRQANIRRGVKRNLDGDLVHDAEEIYAPLPNRLFAFWAGDAKGKRQDSVPPNVASAGRTSVGNDARIHPRNCVMCHVEGIRPLSDWGRRVYRAGRLNLVSPDYVKQERLTQLYLSDLDKWVTRDQADYAEALWKASEMKPAELAAAFEKHVNLYLTGPAGKGFSLDDVLPELGVAKAHWLANAKAVTTKLQKEQGRSLDPSVNSLLLVDPIERVRREDVEELFAALMDVGMGIVPIGEPYKDAIRKE